MNDRKSLAIPDLRALLRGARSDVRCCGIDAPCDTLR